MTKEQIEIRIALLESRKKDNSAIIAKLKRKLHAASFSRKKKKQLPH